MRGLQTMIGQESARRLPKAPSPRAWLARCVTRLAPVAKRWSATERWRPVDPAALDARSLRA